MKSANVSFSHPDYTVGPGVTPGPPSSQAPHQLTITGAKRVTD
ncbi:hypothetical protein FHS14_002589 [Paenibacillus baekrokdamisoli]|nr:hypothetical protein [Paenibacillus baekrokdamisoli]